MRLMRLALAVMMLAAGVAPAAAQRYTAKQDGDLIELADTTAQMNVSVVWNMCNAWRIQVKGKDLVRSAATLADFQSRPGFNGMPILAPFANRLDETAFYANGKKYNFDLELGNVRGPIPSTGYVNGSKAWQLVEAKADQRSAWVSCRLDFFKNPLFMAQFPFAHTITAGLPAASSTSSTGGSSFDWGVGRNWLSMITATFEADSTSSEKRGPETGESSAMRAVSVADATGAGSSG